MIHDFSISQMRIEDALESPLCTSSATQRTKIETLLCIHAADLFEEVKMTT